MSNEIFAIDPGCHQSAWCLYRLDEIGGAGILPNAELLALLRNPERLVGAALAVEKVQCYGMAVGEEVFETVLWSGRFIEAWRERGPVLRVPRVDVKLHLCHQANAKDPNVRQALIDRFGGSAALEKRRACSRCKSAGEVKSRLKVGGCAMLMTCPKCEGRGYLGQEGALAHFKADMWAALGVAVTAAGVGRVGEDTREPPILKS